MISGTTQAAKMYTAKYSYLVSDENVAIRWECMICDNPNYYSLCYGSTAIQTSNSFSLLDELMNTSGEQNIPNPVHSSTPKQKEKTTRKEPFTPLRILNVNCQSIKNKQHQIENLVDSTKPDIIIATETWLDQLLQTVRYSHQTTTPIAKTEKATKLVEVSLLP